jgi:hypothetical protein
MPIPLTYKIEDYQYNHPDFLEPLNGKRIIYYGIDGNEDLIEEYIDSSCIREGYSPQALNNELTQAGLAYRSALRNHFGPNAETNRDITLSSVSAYFISRRLNGNFSYTDASDMIILKHCYDVITGTMSSNETWSFFDRFNDALDQV